MCKIVPSCSTSVYESNVYADFANPVCAIWTGQTSMYRRCGFVTSLLDEEPESDRSGPRSGEDSVEGTSRSLKSVNLREKRLVKKRDSLDYMVIY